MTLLLGDSVQKSGSRAAVTAMHRKVTDIDRAEFPDPLLFIDDGRQDLTTQDIEKSKMR